MDDQLNYHVNVKKKKGKCNKIIGILKRFSIILALNSVLTLYKMFIRTRIDYEDLSYGKPNSKMFCKKIESAQHKSCLANAEATQGRSQEKLYQELRLESLNGRRWYFLFIFIKPKRSLILICIITIQIQLIIPDHHKMKLLEPSH